MRPRIRAAGDRPEPPEPWWVRPKQPTEPEYKTKDIGPADRIHVRSKVGTGIFRDGMTVGQFINAVPNRKEGLRLLARCQKAGTIGFVQGDVKNEVPA